MEIMTQRDYSKDVLAAPTGNLLVGNADAPPPSISFNTRDAGEIAKFTEEGFYYKGEFVDDAGEVHRLLKEVLGQMKSEQACDDVVPKAVSYVELISDDELNAIYEKLVKGHWGENKQPGEEHRMYGFARTVLAEFKAQ